jgi:hypothetical protein
MPEIKDIVPCQRGYHLCRAKDLIEWLNVEIYEAEGRGKSIRDKDKDVFEQARLIRKIESWNEKTARLFAADCAEHVLPIFEKTFPDDKRPREAIQAARDFANGKISVAAGAAAWAAEEAAWAAEKAAWAAARAAWAAAGAAAWAAEKKWQAKRLFFYLDLGIKE